MKKKNLLLTFLLTALILGGAVNEAWADDNFTALDVNGNTIYYTSKSTSAPYVATVTYNTTTAPGTYSGDVVIPSTVEYNEHTYTVTTIGTNAFKNSTGLTSITIPSSITTMPSGVFGGCNSITTINYNATNISTDYSSGLFYDSRATITTINIGENVTRLPNYIFSGITHAFSVTIPASVTNIGASAFRTCTGLTSVTLNEGLQRIGQFAFNGCNNASFTSIYFPSTLTFIDNNAFENCTKLTSVTIPASVNTLNGSAFKGCTDITSLTLNEGLVTIGASAFYGCNKIASALIIPESVTSIGNNVFYGCSKITSVDIRSNITTIPANAFQGCSSITSVTLPHSLNTIEASAFRSCSNSSFTSIIIPESVTEISNNAFSYCSNLANVYMLSTTAPTLSDKNAFQKNYSSPYTYPTINVMKGSSSAFSEASNWSDLTIEEYTTLTLANLDLTNSVTPLTIPSGVTLTLTGTATNTTAANLIIEDGGQLITSSNNVAATVQKSITGHGAKADFDGWTFIASPVVVAGGVNPEDVSGMTEGNFDLYRFNENADLEWENYKNTAAHSDFKLVNGKGYLYANESEASLNFEGTVNPSTPNIEVSLQFNEGKRLAGWNLVGNPFTADAYITDRDYYRMVYDKGRVVIDPETSSSGAIRPCEGVMVKATGTEQVVTFTTTEPAKSSNNGNVQIALAQNVVTRGESSSQTLDKAIVSFNEGSQLGKFYFGSQDANLYIPMNNEEYAIVSSSAQGEMPVNFKAHRDGQYTITVNPQEVEMGYLHLVDNIGGKDIDLLATPSYTFNAKADDYESRFRLVFSANMVNADLDDDFAFFSNGQLVITNEGESILQVIDVNGRIVMTESVNGTCSKAINVKAGVYVLRLIQGTDVKTQKIIVK